MKKIIMFFLMAIMFIRVIADTEIVNGIEWNYEIENEKAEIIPEPDEEPEEMTHTSTTEVPVPYVWLNAYPELMSRYEGDYEAAANSVAANGINKVWECYVAGLNPTNITAKFISIITFNENSPVITWDPNVEGRIYTIEGTSTLNPLEWDTPTNETHRFFRVKVSLPQEGVDSGTTDKIIMILFDARGGSVSPDNITYESNGVLGKLPIPTFEGYAFVGWYDDINGGTEYTSTTPVPHEDMTLYAVWEAETYTVTFNANGGEGTMSNQTFTYGVEQALAANAFDREGHTFAGWATSADGEVVHNAGANISVTAPTTLYAVWTPNTYAVTFNANGGSGEMSNQTFTYGVEQALSSNLYNNVSCTFEGWATSADGEVVYADGEVVENLTKEVDGVAELFAVWKFVDKVQLWEGGPYWATKNIGATKPEDYGYYFWWGDTVGYKRRNNMWVASDGSLANFSFKDYDIPTYGAEDFDLKSEGWITSSRVLASSHDAARAHWGANWEMPTDSELQALRNNCTWIWTSVNGVNGYIVRGKGAYSGASIFLPAAGHGNGTSLYNAGSRGYYWSSVPSSDGYDYYFNSRGLTFYSGSHYMYNSDRCNGRPVRPVSVVH